MWGCGETNDNAWKSRKENELKETKNVAYCIERLSKWELSERLCGKQNGRPNERLCKRMSKWETKWENQWVWDTYIVKSISKAIKLRWFNWYCCEAVKKTLQHPIFVMRRWYIDIYFEDPDTSLYSFGYVYTVSYRKIWKIQCTYRKMIKISRIFNEFLFFYPIA